MDWCPGKSGEVYALRVEPFQRGNATGVAAKGRYGGAPIGRLDPQSWSASKDSIMSARTIVGSAILAGILAGAGGSNAVAGNLIKDGSFEVPAVTDGSYELFSNGQTIDSVWTVVGASGNVAVVSGDFTQNGYTFPAKKGVQWLDLTGTSNSATESSKRSTRPPAPITL
jgi:hypothetical protein